MMIHRRKNAELNCHKNVVKTAIKTLISTAAKSVARDCIRPCVSAVMSCSSVEGDIVTVLQCCSGDTRHCSVAGCCSCPDIIAPCHAAMHISCLMGGPHVMLYTTWCYLLSTYLQHSTNASEHSNSNYPLDRLGQEGHLRIRRR